MLPAAIFAGIAMLFAGLYVSTLFGRWRMVEAATREHRIALAYIAYRRPRMADEFAVEFLAGDTARLATFFPDFAAYRVHFIHAEEEDNG